MWSSPNLTQPSRRSVELSTATSRRRNARAYLHGQSGAPCAQQDNAPPSNPRLRARRGRADRLPARSSPDSSCGRPPQALPGHRGPAAPRTCRGGSPRRWDPGDPAPEGGRRRTEPARTDCGARSRGPALPQRAQRTDRPAAAHRAAVDGVRRRLRCRRGGPALLGPGHFVEFAVRFGLKRRRAVRRCCEQQCDHQGQDCGRCACAANPPGGANCLGEHWLGRDDPTVV